jgi:DNA (cytosine-5)-methyltransferase 1
MKKQNKGEWSEFLTKLSILANPYVFVEQQKKLVRSIKISNKTYIVLGKSVYESISQNGCVKNRFVCFSQEIKDKLPIIYKQLKLGKRSFNLKEAEKLANKFGFNTSCDVSHDKGDVVLTFEELTAFSTQESVSLKSFLGDNPTLLNASKYSTRIRYKIDNINEEVIQNLASKNLKARQNLSCLTSEGAILGNFYFSETMENNLDFLNAKTALAQAVLMHFTKQDKEVSSMNYLNQSINDEVLQHNAEQAVKRLLKASLLGMNPSEGWDGVAKTSENLLIAMPDMTCKMLKGGTSVENFLYENCYIDTPSQSKHSYGKIYQSGKDWYIDLNFQIRIKKNSI